MTNALANPAAFFANLKAGAYLGPTLSTSEVSGCEAILDACGKAGWSVGWTAYALATAWHETAHTMQPVKEMGGDAYLTRMYDIEGMRPDKARLLGNVRPGDGIRFAGRGYVQLTGRVNYTRADKELNLLGALVNTPEFAREPDIAAEIMVRGMAEGWFTGRKLSQYVPTAGTGDYDGFLAARRVINGTDKAADIARAAMHFRGALVVGQWGKAQRAAA